MPGGFGGYLIPVGSTGAGSVSGGTGTVIVSGTTIVGRGQYLGPFFSGSALATITSEEFISGPCGVVMSPSGNIRTAMASISGRIPAIGIVMENLASGVQGNVYTDGFFQFPAAHVQVGSFSGFLGQQVFVGRSGAICSQSGGLNSGGLLSGDVTQPIGFAVNSGGVFISMAAEFPAVLGLISSGNIASGQIGNAHLAAASVWSGAVGSGAVMGQAGGGSFNIGSGTVGTNDLTSGILVTGARYGNVFADGLTLQAGEPISGVRAVLYSPFPGGVFRSGVIVTAMAAVSGRMPAMGVLFGNVASGALVATSGDLNAIYTFGTFILPSGMSDFAGSGFIGRPIYVGRSGQLVTFSGSWNSGGFLSGDLSQPIAMSVNSGALVLNMHYGVTFALSGLNLF